MDSMDVIPLEPEVEDVKSIQDTVEVSVDSNDNQPSASSRNVIVRLRNNPNTALVIVTFAFFVDYLLFLACVPILPLYGKTLHLTDIQIGLLFSSRAIAQVCSNPVMGVISDKFGRRLPMLGGLFVITAATLLFAFSNVYFLLLIARIIQGIGSAANVTGGLALLADYYPTPEERSKKISTALMGISTGVLAGAPVGGALYALGGKELPFLVIAALVALDGIARWILLAEPPHIEGKSSAHKTVKEQVFMYFDIVRDIKIMLVVLSLFLGNGLIAMMEVTFPLFLDEIFKFPSWAVGLTYGGNTLAYTITMAIIGRLKFRRSRGLILGVTVMGSSAIIILLIKHPGWVIPVWIAMGSGMALVDGCASPELANLADVRHPGSYGKVYAVAEVGKDIGFMLTPVVGTALLAVLNYQGTWLVFGIVLVTLAPFIFCGFFRETVSIKRVFEQIKDQM